MPNIISYKAKNQISIHPDQPQECPSYKDVIFANLDGYEALGEFNPRIALVAVYSEAEITCREIHTREVTSLGHRFWKAQSASKRKRYKTIEHARTAAFSNLMWTYIENRLLSDRPHNFLLKLLEEAGDYRHTRRSATYEEVQEAVSGAKAFLNESIILVETFNCEKCSRLVYVPYFRIIFTRCPGDLVNIHCGHRRCGEFLFSIEVPNIGGTPSPLTREERLATEERQRAPHTAQPDKTQRVAQEAQHRIALNKIRLQHLKEQTREDFEGRVEDRRRLQEAIEWGEWAEEVLGENTTMKRIKGMKYRPISSERIFIGPTKGGAIVHGPAPDREK